jgi:ABC-2 type transport system permease protein|tara:strand:- start:32 stop:799 length:768 start_codon:yes stop_codon:yes gene_type:complete
MRAVLAIAKRELGGFFSTPMGWLCLVGFVVISGFFFALMTSEFSVQATQAAFNPYLDDQVSLNEWLIQPFFANTSVILLMISPAISMRLLAEDRRQRSIELLLSSPISSGQIVLGKYLGAMGFVTAMLTTTLPLMGLLYWWGTPDTGVVMSCYAATWLMAASFIAVGLLTSAMTENQIVALILGFGLLLVLWLLTMANTIIDGPVGEVLSGISMLSHLDQLMKGLLHSSDIFYFVSFIAFFLFATTQRVEAYRWR